jgi:hypothetical protein
MPGIVEPVVGTGDSTVSAKDAEKLAAMEACVRLSARNLFTNVRLSSLSLSLTRSPSISHRGRDEESRIERFFFPFLFSCSLIYLLEQKGNIRLYILLHNHHLLQ